MQTKKRKNAAWIVRLHPSAVRRSETNETGHRMGWRGVHAHEFEKSAHRLILLGMAEIADRHAEELGSEIGQDYVLGDAWLAMLRAFRVMLDGELGGMDGGSLWGVSKEIALAAGFSEHEADEAVRDRA